jgi:hypothetical protein
MILSREQLPPVPRGNHVAVSAGDRFHAHLDAALAEIARSETVEMP